MIQNHSHEALGVPPMMIVLSSFGISGDTPKPSYMIHTPMWLPFGVHLVTPNSMHFAPAFLMISKMLLLNMSTRVIHLLSLQTLMMGTSPTMNMTSPLDMYSIRLIPGSYLQTVTLVAIFLQQKELQMMYT
jgi:hypothetical protein